MTTKKEEIPITKSGIKISQDRILMIIIALFVGYQSFKDTTSERIGVSEAALSRLEVKVEGLKISIERIERLISQPSTVENRIQLEISALREQVIKNSSNLLDQSRYLERTRMEESALEDRVAELEARMDQRR